MKYNAFFIGQNFRCGERLWRGTDIGTRVIVAIPIDYTEITTVSGKPSSLLTLRALPNVIKLSMKPLYS